MGIDGRSYFSGFLLRQQRIGTRGHLTHSRRGCPGVQKGREAEMASRKPAKYRPGIDDPPVSRWAWLAGVLGITALAGAAAAFLKRFRRS
jgi:hypothetical protein